ncbi:MAG: 4Fe-4S dicluster domain-containing protein, partial [Myxococcota bacterium]
MSALAEAPVNSSKDAQATEALAALQRLPMFQALTSDEMSRVAAEATLVHHQQDRIVPRGGDAGTPEAYCFVVRGQVAFAEFEQGKVPEPPKNKKKRLTPTMQVAHRVVALFDVGEFFTNAHAPYARSDDGEKYDMALFTCVNVDLLMIPKERLDAIVAVLPSVHEAIEVKAEEAYYRQTLLKLEGRSDLLDLYVKQGFEYAKAIKVIQTDKCIDCDECVKACEDRHGVARIERFGPRIGLIQFTQNCRTCDDARCISACNFDAIGHDEDQEVIVYDNCVGCTRCAKDCPHEAIRMVDIKPAVSEEAIDIVKMVEGDKPKTQVAKGEEKKAKKKKPKRIANKCDHCFGFSDMACISACPTGAIIQIDPRALFRRDGGLIDRAEKYFEPTPLEHGWAATTRTQGVWALLTLFAL